MIMTTYHDFRSLRWAIRPVCPTKSRDITSSGWARTGNGGGRGGFGSGTPCPNDRLAMIMNRAKARLLTWPVLLEGAECRTPGRLRLVIMRLVPPGRHLSHDHDRSGEGTLDPHAASGCTVVP